ncbi:MAG: AAA family ATPase [Pseudomonadota bacterium]
MKRSYEHVVSSQLQDYGKMAFLCGPRQVGKTTIAKSIMNNYDQSLYLNWDYPPDRQKITGQIDKVGEQLTAAGLDQKPGLLVLDELHKLKTWKNLVKGFFDHWNASIHIIVTGSAQLNAFSRGGDSLMGRYFMYTIHPISAREMLPTSQPLDELFFIQQPCEIQILLKFGGFPDPLLRQDMRFLSRWRKLRHTQLLREDLRDITAVRDVNQLEMLATLLIQRAGNLVNYTNLSKQLMVSDQTIRRWCQVLESIYFCYFLQPWSININRSLVKEPKVYLWDWSLCIDTGAQFENMVISHLLKSVHYWNEQGFGEFGLYFLRDKDQREIDLLVTRDGKPWILVETKVSDTRHLSPQLRYFQEQTKAPFAFQVVKDMPYIDRSCFEKPGIFIVPAQTFLSQLL